MASSISLDFIRQSLTYCSGNRKMHERCPQLQDTGSVLPTRVVDCSSHDHLYLLESNGLCDRYVALSYVWGEDQPHKTTTQNIDQYLCSIDPALLPQTIQDAIWTTRALDLKYLWVDTLCIIQDCEDDRNHELARMCDIYSEAHLTIIAASARRASEGFLQHRKDTSVDDVKLPFILPDGSPQLGTLRASLVRWAPQYAGSDPISGRGWCFQESVLSPRCVVFSSHTVQYQCASTFECAGHAYNPCWTDGGHVDARPQYKLPAKDALGDIAHVDRLPAIWRTMVEEYSRTAVTVSGDRLVALSGVAQRFHTAFQTEYLAGLWRDRLLEHLQWYTEPTHPPQLPAPAPRPKGYRAPTWSWASVDGAIQFEEQWQRRTGLAKVVRCETTLKLPALTFGEVTSGILVLRAPTIQCKLEWCPQSFCANAYVDPAVAQDEAENARLIRVGLFKPDSVDDANQRARWATLVLLSRVEAYPRDAFVGFVVELEGGYWRRTGWFANNVDSHNWNDADADRRAQDVFACAPITDIIIL